MISTWSEICEQIQTIQDEARREGSPLWYRGQSLASWSVKSTIHRRVDSNLQALQQTLCEEEKIKLMRSMSQTLFHKFKSRGWPLLNPEERSMWGIVFAMQHYGVATRLVDWTENFVCALYFAQRQRKQPEDAAIFILEPQRLNRQTIGREGLVSLGEEVNLPMSVDTHSYHPAITRTGEAAGDIETLAVAPVLTNARMLAQRSTFTLSGASFEPLEARYPNCIKKIVLPASAFDDTQRFLAMAAQSHFGYFPDLDGLRQELMDSVDALHWALW
ncbi:MAG TPA: FRG domain-containing protein [Terriglobales bacterium]